MCTYIHTLAYIQTCFDCSYQLTGAVKEILQAEVPHKIIKRLLHLELFESFCHLIYVQSNDADDDEGNAQEPRTVLGGPLPVDPCLNIAGSGGDYKGEKWLKVSRSAHYNKDLRLWPI